MAEIDTSSSSPTPSGILPPRWFIRFAWRVHRALHRWSGGRFGLRRPSTSSYGLARLTTTGRRSGEPRSVMIGYYLDGEAVVTMAMNGWAAPEPAWWLNLQADPRAVVETVDGEHPVVARAAEGPERADHWERWRRIEKGKLDSWAARRPTETAVVILEPERRP